MNAPHALAVTEGERHRLIAVNPAFCTLMGISEEDVRGLPYTEAFSEPSDAGPLPILQQVLASGHAQQDQEVERRRADSETALWSYTVWPAPIGSNDAQRLILEVRDQTEQMRSVQRLQDLTVDIRQINERLLSSAIREQAWAEKAEAAAKAKSDFLAMMSHELRTPLTGIVGYTDVLETEVPGPITDRQQECLDRIRTCSDHLLGLIEGVLAFAQLEAETTKFRPERVDLCKVAREAAAIIEPVALRKGLSLAVETPVSTLAVETDMEKVRQILLNLLGNAVKFTDRGEVTLQLEVEPDLVRLLVSDTGIGIRPADLERIFEPFAQMEEVTRRRFGGTGLGLAISRTLAAMLGGGMNVQSTPGEGSTFTLSLPRSGQVAA